MNAAFTESVVEEAALTWLESVGWAVAHGPDIAPDQPLAERRDYGEAVLSQRLRDALARPNPQLPAEALDDAFRQLTRPEGAEPIRRNRALHRLLVDGVTVERRDTEGAIRGARARAIDFDDVLAPIFHEGRASPRSPDGPNGLSSPRAESADSQRWNARWRGRPREISGLGPVAIWLESA